MDADPPEVAGLARPAVTVAQAADVARRYWGLHGRLVELGSQQDRNFLVEGPGRTVLKLAHAATGLAELSAQGLALRELAAAGVRVPLPVPSLAGADVERVEVGGATLLGRVLGFVAGTPLIERAAFGVAEAGLLGDTAGRVAAALAGFRHPGTIRRTQWDLRAAGDVVADLLRFVPAAARPALAAAREDAVRRLAPLAGQLPEQVIHADVTDDNVVVGPDGTVGVIDFGDLQHGWRVAELAATCAAVLMRGDDPAPMLATVRAFAAHVPLTDDELAALWPLVVLRTAVLVVSNYEQAALDAGSGNDSGNDYVGARRDAEWRSFRVASSWDAGELAILVRAAAAGLDGGRERRRPAAAGGMRTRGRGPLACRAPPSTTARGWPPAPRSGSCARGPRRPAPRRPGGPSIASPAPARSPPAAPRPPSPSASTSPCPPIPS